MPLPMPLPFGSNSEAKPPKISATIVNTTMRDDEPHQRGADEQAAVAA